MNIKSSYYREFLFYYFDAVKWIFAIHTDNFLVVFNNRLSLIALSPDMHLFCFCDKLIPEIRMCN